MSDSSPAKEEAPTQPTPPAETSSAPSDSAPAQTSSATPTLNNLLNKPSSAESTPAPTQTSSGPPSNATVPFGSPQASPVPNGSAAKPHPPPASQPQQLPPHQDAYAATAAAVAAGAGSYPMPKNPGMPPGAPLQAMYEQAPPPHMQAHPPPHHVYYGQPPPPHHPYWQQMPRYPGVPPQGSPYYPPPPQAYPPQYYPPPQPHQGPPPPMHMQHRPPVPPADYIKAQQQRDGAATPAAIGGQLVPQSPGGASSVAGGEDGGLDAAKSPSWAARSAPQQPSTSAAAGAPPQGMPPQPVAPGKNIQSIVDKLTGPVTEQNPARVMPDRRRFFESLVLFCEQNGDPITAPPQVSKQNIDLHRLYIAVRSKGGFMEVTKSKIWKNLCQQASSAITESSAAGYQLRKHYEKYLLKMECAETHRSYDEMIEFANKLKKKKKPAERDSTGGAGPSDTGAATPATPGQQHTGPPSAASTPAPQGAPGAPPMQQPPPQATPTPAPPRPVTLLLGRCASQHRHSNTNAAITNANQPAAISAAVKALLLRLLQRPRLSLLPVLVSLVVVRSAHSSSEGIAPPSSGHVLHGSSSYAAVAYPSASGNRLPNPQQQNPHHLAAAAAAAAAVRASGPGGYPVAANGQFLHNYYAPPQRAQYPSGCSPNPSSSASSAYAYRRAAADALYPPSANGQGPPPAGYHPGPPPPGADPNAAYYYPQQQQQPHGWPQGAPPQGYPYGAPRMPPPQSYEEQQRYYQQHPHMQPMPQQPPAQQHPSNTLQVDVAGGSQVNSRAPSTGPAAGTPDSSSQMSAPGEDAANRPQSRPAVAPTPPVSITQQQQQPPPQGYYPGAAPSTSYGSPRPPPPRPTYPMAADGASTSGAYPPGMYPPGTHPPPMWQQQPRYPGQPQVPPQQQMQPPQGYSQQRRAPFPPYHLGQPGVPPGAPSPGSGAAAQMRQRQPMRGVSPQPWQHPQYIFMMPPQAMIPHPGPSLQPSFYLQYGAQPPQPGPPQGAVPQPTPTPSMMSSRSQNPAMPTPASHHHAPATTAALMSASSAQQQQSQQQSLFPPGTIEATQPLLRRRRKVLSKDLCGAVPKRVMMALRSALDTEVVWAVNALNVILYDDSNPGAIGAFSIHQQPDLLNLIVEHLRASVTLLFPEVFKKDAKSPFAAIPTIDDDGFWSTEDEKTGMKQLVNSRNSSDFNKVSRFGRGVRVEKKKVDLPLELRRYRPAGSEPNDKENEGRDSAKDNILDAGLGARLAEKLEKAYKLECCLMKEPIVPGVKKEAAPVDQKPDIEVKKEPVEESVEEPALQNIKPAEWTEHVSVKATGLTTKFEALQKQVNRCLAFSNILRGYSFLPGNDGAMARHACLLYLLGRFLKLRCDEVSFATKRRERAEAAYAKLKESEDEQLDSSNGQATNGSGVISKCVDFEDDANKIMDDLANQLRDDAFVILCHLSVQLKLAEHDSEVSWPIFDGLIHWTVTQSITAKDPLVLPGVLPPRAYALEILCKMSVIEANVDLLVATGPWNRFEAFLERLASWLAMSEDVHYREFSLVILNAICNISDEAVYFTCLHTPALAHIVYFLEFTDTAMHSVVTQQGMTALRDSPELMGTSVGMLRRAATLLHNFCRVEECRKLFIKQQQRLLALSMSQLMDSRVAQMIVETLYEVPRAEEETAVDLQQKEEAEKPKEEEQADDSSPTAATTATNDDASSAASTSSPEQKTAESPKPEEKLTNGTPVSEGSPVPSDDSLFRAPKVKKRPATPVVMENGSNGDCKKRRRLENGTNGKKLNGSIEVDHTATTKNSMAAVA
ncbi:hypothetical protein QR680_010941 [Steinernema hermaphroditum]|uniref:ARID domain-containing protein n=1 Tax=Steinernema hermaphroditum TaxID=289476 RepID=A0AA39MCI4_9BILA|nr:hypothetical protein QR680_010941 [Steinernema hermaphroditum]